MIIMMTITNAHTEFTSVTDRRATKALKRKVCALSLLMSGLHFQLCSDSDLV